MKLHIILLMLPLAFARLSIHVDVSKNKDDVKVQLLGEDDHVIDRADIEGFHVFDEPLKEACRKFHGARPSDVYLSSPTPWGDLYQTYGMKQVHRVLKPVKVNILGIRSKPEIITSQEFTNNFTKTAQHNGLISHSVTNTVTNSWNSGHSINVGQEINYEFVLPIGKAGGKTTFSYSHQWGKSGSQAEAVTVSATAGYSVPVAHGETVVSTLTASRGTMELEVTYEASLYGHVALNYERPYKGHHFTGLDVNAVMKAGGIPTTMRRSEIISVGFYSDMHITLQEKNGKRRLLTRKVLVN